MNDLARCLHEQAECASYLHDPAKLAAWCERYGATEEQGRMGAAAGLYDWCAEEVLVRLEDR